MKYSITTTVLSLTLLLGIGNVICHAAEDASEAQPDVPSASPGGLDMNMSLDNLMKQDVVVPGLSTVVDTVNRQESTIGKTPAAVFVITQDMIKRSGARCIPEALRMAPGLDVAKINSSTWAISARGFNYRYSHMLLVQVDRRVVYNSTTAGVYWDMQTQDVVLADVERIEVVRGPGTTMWGSNAVFGVINIITKNSKDTQGALVQGGGGTQETGFSTGRYGGQLADDLHYRVYAQQFERNRGASIYDINDSWRQASGGFRMDYTPTLDDTFTFQGSLFETHDNQATWQPALVFPFFNQANESVTAPGGNVLGRYSHTVDDDRSWQLQAYYDHYSRRESSFQDTRSTYDLDFQYQFKLGENHQFISGANYRNSRDYLLGSQFVSVSPNGFTTQWESVFLQDTMTLSDDFCFFTLGTRLEQHTFGGFKPEPTARLLFTPTKRQSMWLAFSRAAQNPARIQTDITWVGPTAVGVPFFAQLQGNPNAAPDNLNAYEIGYREAPSDYFTYDIAGFFFDLSQAKRFMDRGVVLGPGGFPTENFAMENAIQQFLYGFELSASLKLTDTWRLNGFYSWMDNHNRSLPDPTLNDTNNQFYLRSSWDLGEKVQYDLIGRYVDQRTPGFGYTVPSYFEMDMRLAYQATKTLEFSFVGQNLLNDHHAEFSDFTSAQPSTDVRRGWYGMMSWVY